MFLSFVRSSSVYQDTPALTTPNEFSTMQETCQAKGFPPPRITWTRLIMPLPAGKTEIKEGNLTIRNLKPVDGGLYQCIATNSMGTKHFTMNVNVQRRGMLTIELEKLFLLLARS